MKRVLIALLMGCVLCACTGTTREHLTEAKKATSCELTYERIGVSAVKHIPLTPEKQAAVLKILAQLQPGDDSQKGRVHIKFSPNAIFTTIRYTTSAGKEHDLNMRDIGSPESTLKIHTYSLPVKLLDELKNLVSYENNKEATHRTIAEQNRAYMETKAAELQLIRRATAVRLEYREIDSESKKLMVKVAPLTPETQREILTILPRLRLAPADKVVQTPPHTGIPYRYLILTCGDKEVALRLGDIRPTDKADKAPWQSSPYLLDAATHARLRDIAQDPAEGPGQV